MWLERRWPGDWRKSSRGRIRGVAGCRCIIRTAGGWVVVSWRLASRQSLPPRHAGLRVHRRWTQAVVLLPRSRRGVSSIPQLLISLVTQPHLLLLGMQLRLSPTSPTMAHLPGMLSSKMLRPQMRSFRPCLGGPGRRQLSTRDATLYVPSCTAISMEESCKDLCYYIIK